MFSQVDSNKDRLVSLDEFLVATKKKEFLEPDSWEVRPNISNIIVCMSDYNFFFFFINDEH